MEAASTIAGNIPRPRSRHRRKTRRWVNIVLTVFTLAWVGACIVVVIRFIAPAMCNCANCIPQPRD